MSAARQEAGGPSGRRWIIACSPAPVRCHWAALAAGACLALLGASAPAMAQEGGGSGLIDLDWTGPRAIALIAVLAFILTGLIAWRPRMSAILKGVAFWGGLFVVLLGVYAYRDRIDAVGREVASVVLPGETFQIGDDVIVRRNRNDHFRLKGRVDGHEVTFLFDTGASSVVLTHGDAKAAGVPVDTLNYSMPVMTANGIARVANWTIPELIVETIRLTAVQAAVAPPGALEISLLGNTFLNRIGGYSVSQDRLVLKP